MNLNHFTPRRACLALLVCIGWLLTPLESALAAYVAGESCGATFTQVTTGAGHTCGIHADGSVVCWGINAGNPPAVTFTQVAAGGGHTCGIKIDGTVSCWGTYNTYGQATPPAGTFTQLAAGGEHTCGIKPDGSAACWGKNDYGQSTPPAQTFTQISAGGAHTCGIKTDGSVACWGANLNPYGVNVGQATPPPGTFTQVAAGAYHTCGIKLDTSVACWGGNGYGQSTPPAQTFTQLAAGTAHTCGLKADGSVACWGSYVNPQNGAVTGPATPPTGTFTQIAAGLYSTTCGVTTGGSIPCSGWTAYGAASPPCCGDGFVHAGLEACDDGNAAETDDCLTTCLLNVCNDGFINAGVETCEDGNLVSGDGCDENCTLTGCGNGVATAGEECDDGNAVDTDSCLSTCVANVCGDGIVNTGVEGCDAAALNSDSLPDACRTDCTSAHCGDAVIDSGEQCDDGNAVATDACPSTCLPNVCGDGFVHAGVEACDDGNPVETDTCLSTCLLNVCGDGFANEGVEACDDGNLFNGDGCDQSCTAEICGDGIVSAGETCDDANAVETDECLSTCVLNVCGDGFANGAVEQCDDGNLVSGDGCDENCTGTRCRNGIVTAGEICDDGNFENGDGCDGNCTVTACGNGVRTPGEQCDDGNLFNGDGCQDTCLSSPGQLDPTFDSDGIAIGAPTDEGNSPRCPVAVLGDGRIVAAYPSLAGSFAITRYNADGSVDTNFGDSGVTETPIAVFGSVPMALAVQDDGKLLVAGSSDDGTRQYLTVARYTLAGALDPSFHQDGIAITEEGRTADGIAVDGDGTIVVAGTAYNGTPILGARIVVRYRSNGNLDTTFDADGIVTDDRAPGATSMVLQPDGKIVAVGNVKTYGAGWGNLVFTRYESDGKIDKSFGIDGLRRVPTGTGWGAYLALQSDGRIVVVADVIGPNNYLFDLGLFRFNADGSLDTSFNGGGVVTNIGSDDDVPGGIVIGSDDKITVTGRANSLWASGEIFLARFDANGFPDTGFAENGHLTTAIGFGEDRGSGIALQADGKLVVAGDSNFDGNSGRLVVLRYLSGTCGDYRAQTADGEECDDGNAVDGDGCRSDCTSEPVVGTVGVGGTVSTDPLNEGATPSEPVQTSLTTPTGGTVRIEPPAVPETLEGLQVVGVQLQIEAPPANAAVPLSITLTIDASAIPTGVDPSRLEITRDGVQIPECSGPAGTASPDPCVHSRVILVDGDVQITVLTSHASLWSMVVRGLVEDERHCVNDIGKAGIGVAKAQGKVGSQCLEDAVGTAHPQVEACMLADADDKIAKSKQKTTEVAADKCVPAPPFGFTSATTVNFETQEAALGLFTDLFGPGLDGVVATNDFGATCQTSALKALQKVFDKKSKTFLDCAKAGLEGKKTRLMVAAGDVERCYETLNADSGGKLAKLTAKLGKKISDKCGGSSATLLTGACGAEAEPEICLDSRVDCRICTMFNATIGLDQDCDLFDDVLGNGSCE